MNVTELLEARNAAKLAEISIRRDLPFTGQIVGVRKVGESRPRVVIDLRASDPEPSVVTEAEEPSGEPPVDPIPAVENAPAPVARIRTLNASELVLAQLIRIYGPESDAWVGANVRIESRYNPNVSLRVRLIASYIGKAGGIYDTPEALNWRR